MKPIAKFSVVISNETKLLYCSICTITDNNLAAFFSPVSALFFISNTLKFENAAIPQDTIDSTTIKIIVAIILIAYFFISNTILSPSFVSPNFLYVTYAPICKDKLINNALSISFNTSPSK